MNTTQQYDAVIIGAGIHGVGVAQALAHCGVNVCVVEKHGEAGSETSQKSSKLIHGGLRYLETAQFSLVRECLQERKLLCANAPRLVQLKPFYFPVYQGQSRGSIWLRLGLSLYYLLGGGRFSKHPATKADSLGIKADKLHAIYEYQDAQTDDQQLTIAVAESAQAMGASFFYSHRITSISHGSGGYRLTTDIGTQFSTRCLINAAGAYVNHVAQLSESLPYRAIELVQGTHIIVNRPAPVGCIYANSPVDDRPIFFLPWYGKLMVGTTELSRGSDPYANHVTQAEIDYLLIGVNYYFPQYACDVSDVERSFSGLRVLPKAQSNLNSKARETHFECQFTQDSQYLAIYGGKLTAYRATSEAAVRKLMPFLKGAKFRSTRHLKF